VTPVVLWWAWKDQDDEIPDTEPPILPTEIVKTTHSRRRKALYDTIILLCVSVRMLSTKVISMDQAKAGQMYLANYCQRMILLGAPLTINHHIAMHFSSMIKIFGPIYSWWLFAFERFNGMLEKVNHNGHDGGQMELTMLRNWVQTHLIYELLLGLPPDASPHERRLVERIINTEASKERGGMMTQIAIFRGEASADRVSLPKRLPKPTNLHTINLSGPGANGTDLYTLLFNHCRQLWPDLRLRRELSLEEGTSFIGSKVARRLPYVRKDGLRYGSTSNTRSKADSFAFIEYGGTRVPVQIKDIFAVQIQDSGKPLHVCAVVQRLFSDQELPHMPWDLL
jgi:hypothetical protein